VNPVSSYAVNAHERRGLLLSPDRRTFIQSMPFENAQRVSGNSVAADTRKRFAYTFSSDRFRTQHVLHPSRQPPVEDRNSDSEADRDRYKNRLRYEATNESARTQRGRSDQEDYERESRSSRRREDFEEPRQRKVYETVAVERRSSKSRAYPEERERSRTPRGHSAGRPSSRH
jgi:hypothetical protein